MDLYTVLNVYDWHVWLSLEVQKAKSVTSQWLVELHRPLLFYSLISFFVSVFLPSSFSPSFSVSLHSSSSSSLKAVRSNVDGESEGGAGLVVALVAEQRVNWHHLQVQRVLSGPRHGTGQHQHGADIIDLL